MLIKKIKTSIDARVIQPWKKNNYDKTKYGKMLKEYKNKYKGQRCFFIGNGPSLKVEDLNILYENNEICFAFNRIYNIFDQTQWRPTFYISQDEKMLMGCKDVVDKLELSTKFIPIQLKWYHDICIHDAIYFNMDYQDLSYSEKSLFSDNPAQVIECANTGMYTAAQLAAYMGFKEIYFIGVDHHFHISQNNKGEIIVDNNVKDYFTEKYNEDKDNLYIPNTEKSTMTYVAMKKHCDKRNIHVYNATRGGMLEVFSRINFDAIFGDKEDETRK